MKRVVVAGSLNADLSITAPYCPAGGETLTGEGFFTGCGGKGANQATAAGRFGADVCMCGCVGSDAFGEALKNSLSAAGVNVGLVRTVSGVPTGVAVILVTGGENRIILDKGANACLSENDIDGALSLCRAGDIWLTQLENPLPVVGYGLRRAREKGLFTILNPAPADPAATAFLPYVDLVTPNEGELALLGGKKTLFRAGVKAILTTLGKRGYEIDRGTGGTHYGCIDVKVADTTAAGDTLCGALAAELARGAPLEETASLASKAASIACSRKGAACSIPTREETIAF